MIGAEGVGVQIDFGQGQIELVLQLADDGHDAVALVLVVLSVLAVDGRFVRGGDSLLVGFLVPPAVEGTLDDDVAWKGRQEIPQCSRV